MYTYDMETIYNMRYGVYVQCKNLSTKIRVILMKLAWLVSDRGTLPGVHLLHALMANDAKVFSDTVFEVVHPAHPLPKGVRKELIISNVSINL